MRLQTADIRVEDHYLSYSAVASVSQYHTIVGMPYGVADLAPWVAALLVRCVFS